MLAPADDAQRVDFLGQTSRQLAIRELVARDHLGIVPLYTGRTSAPSSRMLNTFGF
mgnify:CR=1 FL=1